MEQIKNFRWAQGKIDELTGTTQEERYEARRYFAGENRAQRRERERQERKAARKKVKS
jgi:hypothetical protein